MPEPIRCIDCGEIVDQQGDGEYVCEACGLYFTDEDLSDDDLPEEEDEFCSDHDDTFDLSLDDEEDW